MSDEHSPAMECNALVSFIQIFKDLQTYTFFLFFLFFLNKTFLLSSHLTINASTICFKEKEMPQS